MQIYKKLNLIFSRSQKIKFVILIIITFGGGLVETLGVTMIMPFISVATNPHYIFEQPILSYFYNILELKSPNNFIILLAIFLIMVYIVKTLYLFIMYKFQFRFIYNNRMRLSIKLMDSYLKKSYEYHTKKNSSEITQVITQDIMQLFQMVTAVVHLITDILTVACISIALIVIDPLMVTATILLLTTIMFTMMFYLRKSLNKARDENRKSYRGMIKWVSQGAGGIKEIKVLNREQFFIDEYSTSAKIYAEAQERFSFLNQTPKLFIETICITTILVVLSTMLYSGTDISAMIPQLAVFAMAAFKIMPSFSRITSYYNSVVFTMPSVDKVYKELKNNDEINKMPKSVSNSTPYETTPLILHSNDTIKIKKLNYKYPNTENLILENAIFDIPINKSIAFVGKSGAGKTTFADIFLGLLIPNQGSITINGTDIHQNLTEWSKNLGYIPQTIYLCDDTIKRNVAFGIKESEVDKKKLINALKKAQLYDFITTLPQGIDTEIGERGIRLSGGQRQRIGIARAFYNDPEIFVLDEATSALDNDTESAVMEAINAIKGKKTLIIIAHRLSTIQNCDIVYKIENGKVIRER